MSEPDRLGCEPVQAEHELGGDEILYRSLFTHSPGGVVLLDDGGRMLAFNAQAHQQLGYTRDEFAQLGLVDLHPCEERLTVPDHLARLFGEGSWAEFECRHRTKSGEPRHVLARSRLVEVGGARRLLYMWQDVTESKRVEEALRHSEERFRAIFEQAAVGMAQVDARTGRLLRVNDKLCEIVGYSREEMLSQRWQDVTHPDDLPSDREAYGLMLANHRSFSREKRYIRKDTAVVWANVTVSPMWPAGAEPTHHVSVVEDITARKRAEEALRESEEHFRVAFQTSPDSINLNRFHDGMYLAINDGFTQMTGWTEADVLGRSSLELRIWDDPADRARLLAGLQRDGFVRNLEAQFRRKDGTVLTGLMSARVIALRGERYILTITRDISDRKWAEEERDRLKAALHQAAKMEAIGQLAGGVAHDFNNLLTVILSGAEALKRDLSEGSPTEPTIVEEIAAAGRRARDLTQQLLAFARRQVTAPLPLDLNALIRASERLVRPALGEDVELSLTLQPALWSVRCDPGQMEQVILNLAVNARDAMPDGGTLTVETANVEVDERLIAQHRFMRVGSYVRLSIRDSGTGMAPEVKSRIFEPFFTTKPVGRGTGLGLATVYGIVKQSAGYILVESEPGAGTAFALYLPRIAEPAVAAAAPSPVTARHGTETVLVVEDDPQVREVTVRSLRSGGYVVLAARDGPEALEIAARERGPLHLLVTDAIMPGLDGRVVAERLRQRRPEMRVLYVSGHAEEVVVKRGELEPGVEFLPKPFSASSLLARVRDVLDAP